jgi:hypothetical protein
LQNIDTECLRITLSRIWAASKVLPKSFEDFSLSELTVASMNWRTQFCLLFLVLSSTLCFCGCSIWGPALTGSITSRPGKKGRIGESSAMDTSSFDAEGELPLFKTARRLVGNASPVVGLRFTELNETEGRKRGNGTLLAWGYDIASPFEVRMHAQTISTLGHPFQRVVLTGVAGDCRLVSRFLKQTALNHTVEFNSFASGTHLASQLAEFMQSIAMGERPLICHALVCSGIDATLHSIEPSCLVTEVSAVNAGRESELGKRLLAAEYHQNMTLNEVIDLARKVVNPPSLLPFSGSDCGSDGDGDGGEEVSRCRELGFEFCVIYDDEVNYNS